MNSMSSLHPQIEAVRKAQAAAGLRPIEALTPADARAQMQETARSRKAEPLPVGRVQERAIPGPGGPIRLRFYWPKEADAGNPVPAIVYYHGGGHVIGSLDTHDFIARNLCAGARALVASVDYRMGPEHKFPAAVDDSFAALEWVHANAGGLGADPDRFGVHGDSAGANLAAVASLLAREDGGPMPVLQLLIYPVVQLGDRERRSYRLFGAGFYLTTGEMDWYDANYLPDPEQARDWRASPLLADDLSGLPAAVVAIAGFDPLRDEGEEFARRLADAGVAVDVRRVPGLPHGFASAANAGRAPRAAMRDLAAALSAALARAHPGDAGEGFDLPLDERG